MNRVSAIVILSVILLSSFVRTNPTEYDEEEDEYKDVDRLLNDLILFNKTFRNKFSSEIGEFARFRKSKKNPIQLTDWPRLKNFSQSLSDAMKNLTDDYSVEGFVSLGYIQKYLHLILQKWFSSPNTITLYCYIYHSHSIGPGY